MARRHPVAHDESTSRDRTAQLLRRLRAVTRDVRSLNADIHAAKIGCGERGHADGESANPDDLKRRTG